MISLTSNGGQHLSGLDYGNRVSMPQSIIGKVFALFFCLFISMAACYAQTQQGYVKTRGRLGDGGSLIPGQHLSGATISIKERSSVVSDDNGEFSFYVPAETYVLTNVPKNGYELCDQDFLYKTLHQSSNDLVVVMDTPDNILSDRLESERKIRKTLTRQLQEKEDEIIGLKQQQKITEEQYRQLLQDLYSSQENNEKLISEMAARYSSIDFDQMDEFQRLVASYIQNGELARADSLLNTKGSMEERKARLEQNRSVLAANAEELIRRQAEQEQGEALQAKELADFGADCYSRHEICLMKHQNDSAAYWLELRAGVDTLNYKWQLQCGIFLRKYIADYDKAMLYFNTALNALASSERNGEVDWSAVVYSNIGLVYADKGEYPKAMENLQNALDRDIEIYGEINSVVAIGYNNVGYIFECQGKYEQALTYYQKALEIQCSFYEELHPELATNYKNIGGIYFKKGKYSNALEYFQKALDIEIQLLGENHTNVATSYNNIGLSYLYLASIPKSLDYFNKALNIDLMLFGENHPTITSIYNNIGSAYYTLHDNDNALKYFQKALEINIILLGENHPDVALSYNNLGLVYSNLDDSPKALEYYQKSLDIRLAVYGNTHPYVAINYSNIASVYMDMKDYSSALEYATKAVDMLVLMLGNSHPEVATGYNKIGGIYLSTGDYDNALGYFQKALDIRVKVFGNTHPSVANVYNNIGTLYEKKGAFPNAIVYFRKVLDIQLQVSGDKNLDVAYSYYKLGNVYLKQHEYDKALDYFQNSLTIRQELLDKDHRQVIQVKDKIKLLYEMAKEEGVQLPELGDNIDFLL